jgi:hypothetical protein
MNHIWLEQPFIQAELPEVKGWQQVRAKKDHLAVAFF